MDEKLLLEKMQKAFGVEVDFTEIEQKHERKRKENKLLEQFAGALIGIREEPQSPIIEEVVEAVVIEPEPVVEDKQPEPEPELITEIGRQPEPELPKKDIVTQSVIALSKTNQQQGDIQKVADEIPDVYRRELDIIKKSIADFHRFAQRHSQMGGGGAGSVDELTFNVTSVTNSTYQIGRKDYYIGVNYPGPVTISTNTKSEAR
jgi:hypothetical protein